MRPTAALAIVWMGVTCQACLAGTIHAAPDGGADASGSPGEPLALAKAIERAGPGDTVVLQSGTYELARGLAIDTRAGAEAPLVIRAARVGQARLIGGRILRRPSPVKDDARADRLGDQARRHVIRFDLNAEGIEDFGTLRRRGFGAEAVAALEVFVDGVGLHLARWPNEGWLDITSVVEDGGKSVGFGFDAERPQRWRPAAELWVHGYWKHDWADSYEKVALLDAEKKLVRTEAPHGVYGYARGGRFRFVNVLEELDTVGEYYVDRQEGVLYLWPPEGHARGEVVVSLVSQPLVRLDAAAHVVLEGLVIEAGRGQGVRLTGGTSCTLRRCEVRNTGTDGVVISGGRGHALVACDIHGCGETAVVVGGGDRRSLTAAGHRIRNCRLYRFARVCRTYRPGIRISGVGQIIADNEIRDAPHCGILLAGNEHRIEGNELHRLCNETGDVGAFYMGRDWSERGNVIRGNFFHHIGGVGMGSNAVYLDDCASGTTVEGNIFWKVQRGVMIGGGRDNLVLGNAFIDCRLAVWVDARLLGWAADRYLQRRGSWDLLGKLQAVRYDKPPWSKRYPDLASILSEHPRRPRGNVLRANVVCQGKWLELHGVQKDWLALADNVAEAPENFAKTSGGRLILDRDLAGLPEGLAVPASESIGPRRGRDGPGGQ
jgi:hypothetical protein